MNLPNIDVSEINNIENAGEIHLIYQSAYRLEADLIGVDTFPPLERTSSDIASSKNEFYAAVQSTSFLGIVEIESSEYSKKSALIASLAVLPNWSRKGIGELLIQFVLEKLRAVGVTTAINNLPAIALYEKLGFVRTGVFETPEGIQMIEMDISESRLTRHPELPRNL
jgi:ribosomal protein S18 acetylase RimI-like enzyme